MTSSEGGPKRRKTERKDEMVRFGARLPKARAEVVQQRIDGSTLSQQQIGEYLFTAYGHGLIDLFDLMRQVHEIEARTTT